MKNNNTNCPKPNFFRPGLIIALFALVAMFIPQAGQSSKNVFAFPRKASHIANAERVEAELFSVQDKKCTKDGCVMSKSSKATDNLDACKSNLKNIGTALEMYATDNTGRYPKSLNKLTPEYLTKIPTCPCAKKDTYSKTYKCTAKPDTFKVCCTGCNHKDAGVKTNFPAFDSKKGLTEK